MRTIEDDAHEFGAHLRAGGWLLGLLVARNVEKGKGEGRPPKTRARTPVSSKVSASEFAAMANTSHDRVLRYLNAWERAADAGKVPHAVDLAPGDDLRLDEDRLGAWAEFYVPVDGGRPRDATPAAAAAIVEKRGARAVVEAMPREARVAMAQALTDVAVDEAEQTIVRPPTGIVQDYPTQVLERLSMARNHVRSAVDLAAMAASRITDEHRHGYRVVSDEIRAALSIVEGTAQAGLDDELRELMA